MLGKVLVHVTREARFAGRIVEVEGYVGPDDAASHARTGPTKRGALMWGPPGFAYVYLIYGIHSCFNAVCETEGYPGAVLVRAIEPHDGGRGSGPALVCQALRIDRWCSGLDLTSSELRIEAAPAVPDVDVRMGPRVGVDYAGSWASHPWRLWVADSPHVSRRRANGQVYDPSQC